MRLRAGAVLGSALAVLAIASTPADAGETRAQYVAKTDHICKSANRKAFRIFRRLGKAAAAVPGPDDPDPKKITKKERRALVKGRTRLVRAFGTTNAIFGRMVSNIALVPVP